MLEILVTTILKNVVISIEVNKLWRTTTDTFITATIYLPQRFEGGLDEDTDEVKESVGKLFGN